METSRVSNISEQIKQIHKEGYSTWTTGAKEGIGTAYYDPSLGKSRSNVWYTLSRGVLTEVYYPTVDVANLQMLQFFIGDPLESIIVDEQSATEHHAQLLQHDALVYQQRNTANNGNYRISKTYITDPEHNTLYLHVSFHALRGSVGDYELYLYLNPVLTGSAVDDTAHIAFSRGRQYLLASDDTTALAVGASLPYVKAMVNEVGHWDVRDTVSAKAQGDVAFIGQLDLGAARESKEITFTVALGFGSTEADALTSAESTLGRPFRDVMIQYESGWQNYVRTLDSPPSWVPLKQYYAAAMVVKAHEDKLHPGAIVASLSIPWGDNLPATTKGTGGYHLVWARDLYHIATGLAAIGDTATAMRSLIYLDEVQQKRDGSFPQNSWLNGVPYWNGLQLDEAAFPILLAHYLGAYERYESLVKPAADYIVEHGPFTPQERWEENGGLSPSTIAAEIAALVVAAKMASVQRDLVSAAVYLATADKWFTSLDEWLAVQSGKWSDTLYYIRISESSNPNDGAWIEVKNGGGWYPKSEIIDAGFLELVRLGVKSPDDPLVISSLNVIDEVIKCDTPFGPFWYRYNHDGYGEQEDGLPYDGTGIGRLWPVLTGERGEYEVALSAMAGTRVPNNVYGVENLLSTVASSANQGCLIPEQVWDREEVWNKHLSPFKGTGCATPLVWAMAQYLRLVKCIEQGRIVEMPMEVRSRYSMTTPLSQNFTEETRKPTALFIEYPASSVVIASNDFQVKGQAGPFHTIVICSGSIVVGHTTADANGSFFASVHLRYESIGTHVLRILGYDGVETITETEIRYEYRPLVVLEVIKPTDDRGTPRLCDYPLNPVFKSGDFDMRAFGVLADEDNVYFQIELGNLDNPWCAPTGISKQLIDIYLDMDGIPGSGQCQTMGFGAQFRSDAAWEKMIRISGSWCGEAHMYNSDWSDAGPVSIRPNYDSNTITVTVPIAQLGRRPARGWGFMVLLGGECYGAVRPVRATADEWAFGCAYDMPVRFQFADLLVPENISKEALFNWVLDDGMVELPMVRI
ncbi:glycoside hydrolase family 15 protein [Alicyclobacillus fastidiosus]|uniref:Glycoside hydrolase family 15 protein n=1 Tax=Alicyclobacillus fastidiosus TaxID=392011 RepID=A0ABY6ZJX3_9BACL|nr:glucodextranase DOMON-like domain-containing protein [Alicyclobacillus fastidiosus]WAH43090.1 glycoside hydrolase family 15 protein [Alicyclobacillus fastidiosus]GMA65087.1 hypothetical protein GCM10025859_55270 [Alicyclobacillus fastidiosus]